MYRREVEKEQEQIYVLRSEDKKITKIGRSGCVDTRVDTICISERKRYYLVYQSQPLLKEEAIKLEKEIIEYFKEDCIKGKEWLSTHPLKIIEFIVEKIGFKKKEEVYLDNLAEHRCFVSTNSKYTSLTYEHLNGVRISQDYYAYVKTIYNGQYIVLGFSNIKDAYEFVRRNKHLQASVPMITELLFDKSYKEWIVDNYKNYKSNNWINITISKNKNAWQTP